MGKDPKHNTGGPVCSGKCALEDFKGDGNCDDNNNNCGCNYDGGDCCAKSLGKPVVKKYCKQCKCLDPKNGGKDDGGDKKKCSDSKCGAANYKGDGNCDDENNNCGCDFDGGDCCLKAVVKKYCKKCECIDPAANKCDKSKNKCG